MTDNGRENAQGSGEDQGDDTTCIAQPDSTRPMPVAPPQQPGPPQSTWSGGGGASPVGAYQNHPATPQDGSAPRGGWVPPQPGQQPVWNQPPPPVQGYPSAPPPQGYAAGPYQPPSPQYGAAPPPNAPQYAPPQGMPQYNSVPQAPPQYGSVPADPWRPAPPPQQSFSAPPQQSGAAPYAPGQAYEPLSRPAVTHHLAPLEKFGPLLPALLLFIGAFLTWATFKSGGQSVSLNGVGSNNNTANPDLGGAKSTGGWLTILLALCLAGIAATGILGKVKATIVGIVTTVLSVVALVIGLIQFANISSVVNSEAGSGYSGKPGIGVWLTLFAALVGVGLGVAAMITGRKKGASAGSPAGPTQTGSASAGGAAGQRPGPFGQPNQQV